MDISVIMIDGGFRETCHSAWSFSQQEQQDLKLEVLWVEYYSEPNQEIVENNWATVICLNNKPSKKYHSSYCFNEGLRLAKGELVLVIDADQYFEADFARHVWDLHREYEKQAIYGYRFDCPQAKSNFSLETIEELERYKGRFKLHNPTNYGACLSVKKKWLLELNGYDQDPIFSGSFHANGLDVYTRLKNFGLAIRWEPSLKLYHPWHPSTLVDSKDYLPQRKLIEQRARNLQYLPNQGLDAVKNYSQKSLGSYFNKLVFNRS